MSGDAFAAAAAARSLPDAPFYPLADTPAVDLGPPFPPAAVHATVLAASLAPGSSSLFYTRSEARCQFVLCVAVVSKRLPSLRLFGIARHLSFSVPDSLSHTVGLAFLSTVEGVFVFQKGAPCRIVLDLSLRWTAAPGACVHAGDVPSTNAVAAEGHPSAAPAPDVPTNIAVAR